MSAILRNRGKSFDWITFSLYAALLLIGWSMIYASSVDHYTDYSFLSIKTLFGKQILFIAISLVLVLVSILLPMQFWRNFSFLIYFLAILFLLLVLIIGKDVNGARSWFAIGPFSFQPSEFAKFATMLTLASYASSGNFDIKENKSLLMLVALFLLPALLIGLQPDAGSALVFFSFLILLYRIGLSVNYFILLFSFITCFILSVVFSFKILLLFFSFIASLILVLYIKKPALNYFITALIALFSVDLLLTNYDNLNIAIIINVLFMVALMLYNTFHKNFSFVMLVLTGLITFLTVTFVLNFTFNNVLEKHQQDRINVWLRPDKCDPGGALYNVIQSKVAIGSGGLAGKGFLNGSMTKFNFVPEQSTDFIFCTVGEEQGFIGVLALILLYLFLIMRIVMLSESHRLDFVKYYGYGLAGVLFIHFFINIGMTMGLMPIIGIPLPFLSYGGSSVIFFSLMIGVFLSLNMKDR